MIANGHLGAPADQDVLTPRRSRTGFWLSTLFVTAAAASVLGPDGRDLVQSVHQAAITRHEWTSRGTPYASRLPWIQDLYRLTYHVFPPTARVTVMARGGEENFVADRQARMLLAYVICPARVETPDTLPVAEADGLYALDAAEERLSTLDITNRFERVGNVPFHFLYRRQVAPAAGGGRP